MQIRESLRPPGTLALANQALGTPPLTIGALPPQLPPDPAECIQATHLRGFLRSLTGRSKTSKSPETANSTTALHKRIPSERIRFVEIISAHLNTLSWSEQACVVDCALQILDKIDPGGIWDPSLFARKTVGALLAVDPDRRLEVTRATRQFVWRDIDPEICASIIGCFASVPTIQHKELVNQTKKLFTSRIREASVDKKAPLLRSAILHGLSQVDPERRSRFATNPDVRRFVATVLSCEASHDDNTAALVALSSMSERDLAEFWLHKYPVAVSTVPTLAKLPFHQRETLIELVRKLGFRFGNKNLATVVRDLGRVDSAQWNNIVQHCDHLCQDVAFSPGSKNLADYIAALLQVAVVDRETFMSAVVPIAQATASWDRDGRLLTRLCKMTKAEWMALTTTMSEHRLIDRYRDPMALRHAIFELADAAATSRATFAQ